MIFSRKTSWNLEENEFTRAVRQSRESYPDLIDLTISNPTLCDFSYPQDLLAPLAQSDAAIYSPNPFGILRARSGVSRYYRDHGVTVPIEQILITTSTSEAYSYLFRLLCDARDEVLIAAPTYPLFDFIGALDDVCLKQYLLHYDPNADAIASWRIDLESLSSQITDRTRAIVVVNPNNPTGHYISSQEKIEIQRLCRERDLALIVDEVFLDYSLKGQQTTFVLGESPCLTFVMSGLSKVCALPQMKCAWTAISGPKALVDKALARLEVIADTFLSMNTPIQHALPYWLSNRQYIQNQIVERMRTNLAELDRRLVGTLSNRLALEGGWTCVVRVPRTVDGTPFVEAALESGVVVQPGDFYGLPEGRTVLSLLTPTAVWQEGLRLLPF